MASPAKQRQELLERSYGFRCSCPRCQIEEDCSSGVKAALQDIHDWVLSGVQAQANVASSTGKTDEMSAIRTQAKHLTQALESAAASANVPEHLQLWLKASAYAAYELMAVCSDDPETPDPDVVQGLLPIAEVFGRATDMHIFLTAEAFNRTQSKFGPQDSQSMTALKQFLNSLVMRYGRISDPMMQRIIKDRLSVDNYMGRYNLIQL